MLEPAERISGREVDDSARDRMEQIVEAFHRSHADGLGRVVHQLRL